MSHLMTNNRGAFQVAPSHDGTGVNILLDSWPISIQLSRLDPADARKLAELLIEHAAKCEIVKSDTARLAQINLEAVWEAA